MRASFPKGKQKKFINKILSKISVKEIAKFCHLSERTIRDWRREKFLANLDTIRKLCKKTNLKFPSNFELRNDYWYTASGSSAGGIAVFKKYGIIGGDPEYRKRRWHEWWKREGRYQKHPIIGITKPIKKPRFSKELAEFIGIMLGDGCISKYQVSITLCNKDEENYSKFIKKLIRKLFCVPVTVLEREKYSTIDLVVSRINLVRFCIEKLGLKRGNKIKQQIDIPKWIKNNRSYSIACTRGLIDTDGSIFNHRYCINGKLYSYRKLDFTSRSRPLRLSLFIILKREGIKARLAGLYDVRIESQEDMRKYFKIFNSHNPKHLIRYRK